MENINKSLEWFNKAAENGSIRANLFIGIMYATENSIKDIEKSK